MNSRVPVPRELAQRSTTEGAQGQERIASSLSIMQPNPRREQSPAPLTARELQILPLLFMTNAEIAADLGTSKFTVQTQVARLLCKLGLRNRTAAAAWWAEQQVTGVGATDRAACSVTVSPVAARRRSVSRRLVNSEGPEQRCGVWLPALSPTGDLTRTPVSIHFGARKKAA